MKLFEAYEHKNLKLKNRLVMPPMCMYQCHKKDGIAYDFHQAHYISRAIGQVGLIIVEATGVQPNGRITDRCLGLYDDAQVEGMRKIVEGVHRQGSQIALQLNHAGRKSETTGLRHIGPSALAYNDLPLDYEACTEEDIEGVIASFREAAARAHEAGFDGIEIHAAHGYLIHQFISPLSNHRNDEYGEDRFLFLRRVVEAIREVWPEDKALWMRISATDYHKDGLKLEDWIGFLNDHPNIVDMVHVSAGGTVDVPIHAYPGYMLDLARRIKAETGYPSIAVGIINTSDMISYALESDACDLVSCGRELLRNPNLLLAIARERGKEDLIPFIYKRAYK